MKKSNAVFGTANCHQITAANQPMAEPPQLPEAGAKQLHDVQQHPSYNASCVCC